MMWCVVKILPFLALGLGMDDVFLLAHTFSLLVDKPNIDHHVSKCRGNYLYYKMCLQCVVVCYRPTLVAW